MSPNRLKNSLKFRFENKFFFEQWFLIFNFGNPQKMNQFDKFKEIIPPKDRFWADPHIIFRNNIFYIFFEEYLYQNKKGNISMIELKQDGTWSKPQKILDENFHLSYPFLFEYDDETYMIPETHESNTIRIYKCIDFPKKWKLEKTIMKNIDAVDSTLVNYNNKWWLFTGIKNNLDWNNLHIFYSDNPLSEKWIPHSMNPIKTNIRNSRSAGRIYVDNGSLYRPAQISSMNEYGKGIVINKIEVLNEKEYCEKEISTIESWNKKIKGIHTINFEDKLTILDAKWKRRK